jgi:isopentenyl-diphosphate delta-isomerase
MEIEKVILVNTNDEAIGSIEKMEAHEKALLHRAFSVFIFNSKNEFLIQQRAFTKYHSPGLWTNTCCSHPREGESAYEAANRRLVEEMGLSCKLEEIFSFIYKADVGQGLIEHEYDHVFVGYTDLLPVINEKEVVNWKYMTIEKIRDDMKLNPQNYTVWFRIAFDRIESFLLSGINWNE